MKKTKILSGLVMLILCIAVIGMGIYAITPTTHSIQGTITVTGGGKMVTMQVFLNDQTTAISNEITPRHNSEQMQIQDNAIGFDVDEVYDPSEADPITIKIKVHNHSSEALGAFVVKNPIVEGETTTTANIAKTKLLSGEDSDGEAVSDVVKATITGNTETAGYTKIEAGQTVYIPCQLQLLKVGDKSVDVAIDLSMHLETYAVPTVVTEGGVELITNGIQTVSATCTIENGNINPEATTLSSTNTSWNLLNLAFDASQKYGNDELRLPTLKLKMMVQNNGENPIKVTIASNSEAEQTAVKVTTIGNSYIPAHDTGEVSIQFQAIYDREDGAITDATLYPINEFNYTLEVEEVEEQEQTIYERIKYDTASTETEGTMPNRGMFYYIEYGTNPYYSATAKAEADKNSQSYPHREKLRWYVWAKYDTQTKRPVKITSADEELDAQNNKKLKANNTYFFISEYILDDVPFQAELWVNDSDNSGYWDGSNGSVTDYSSSTIRSYLNGNSIRSYSFNDSNHTWYGYNMANGEYINYFKNYGLTDDPIFSQISGRNLESFSSTDRASTVFPNDEIEVDVIIENGEKFWTMSYEEVYLNICNYQNGTGTDTNANAFLLSEGLNNNASNWWLRTYGGYPGYTVCGTYFDDTGYYSISNVYGVNTSLGNRPCFMLAV